MNIHFVISRDRRERYRFLYEPLQMTDINTSMFREHNGLLKSAVGLYRSIANDGAPDAVILIGSDFRNYLWFYVVKMFSSAKVVVRFGGDPVGVRQSMKTELLRKKKYREYIKSYLGIFFSKFLLSHSDGVIVVSDYLRRAVEPYVGDLKKIYVSPPAPQIMPSSNDSARCAGSFYVLTVANLNYKEKADGIVDIVYRLLIAKEADNSGRKIVYDIVGGGHQLHYLRKEVDKVVSEYHDKIDVNVHGQLNDPGSYYSRADLFAYSSTLDSYPLVLVEAQAYGLPIIINDWGPFPEILEDGKGVHFMRDGDDLPTTQFIVRLVQDCVFYRDMKNEALNSYKKKSSLTELSSGLNQFFTRLLSQ